MKSKKHLLVLLFFLTVGFPLTIFGTKKSDELKDTLFSEVKNAVENAKKEKADLLSPESFKHGHEAYMEASKDFDSGKSLESIKSKINKSMNYIDKAIKNVELSSVTLKNLLSVREAAIAAQAPRYAIKRFSKAEELFSEAAMYVERGDVSKARKIADKALPAYKDAEHMAIKEGLLGDVKELRKKVEKVDAENYTPELIKNADKSYKKAEKMIDSRKYDMKKATEVVNEARYLYAHSLALAPLIKSDRKKSHEEIFTDFEKHLSKISSNLGLPENFDKGIDYQVKSINSTIDGIKKDRQDLTARLSNTISESDTRIEKLNSSLIEKEKEIAKLKGKTSEEAERVALLNQKLERENIEKAKYNRIRNIFSPKDEGVVLKDGSDIVLQLHGLTFASGKSTIDVNNFDLLAKVQKAIREYPNAKILVEGHTDSVGDQNFNQILSEERANAVARYLVANNTVNEKQVTALGFGPTDPVAPNNTKEGRAKNRRIDVVIKTD